jgi:hypothetical protein
MNANGMPCHPRTGADSPEGEAAAAFKIAAVASADDSASRANIHAGCAAGLRCSAATVTRHAALAGLTHIQQVLLNEAKEACARLQVELGRPVMCT